MANVQAGAVLRYIRDVAAIPENRDQTDSELLRAFMVRRDQAAFSALVKRHGPSVLAVCRRMLQHVQDAEDAFQATFLVLARQAGSIRKEESLASWLHGVAYRMSKSARRAAARRRKHESQARPRQPTNPGWTVAWQEVQNLVDEETQRLPLIYREAFILCCLENRSCADVARSLGQKEATVRSRVARARHQLQKRLTKRGVSLTAVLSVAAMATNAASGMPASLVDSTVKAALAYTAGKTAAGMISAEVAALVQGVTKTMFYAKLKIATALLMAVSVGTAGFGFLRHQVLAGPGNQADSKSNAGQKPEQNRQRPAQKEALPQDDSRRPPENGIESLTQRPLQAAGHAEAVPISAQVRAKSQPGVQAGTNQSRFLAFDTFDGKFLLNWRPVRFDPSHVSLSKFPGHLTITTQRGTIHADEKVRGEPSARNLFVMPNPLGADTDFVMTTSISEFTPEVAYQQAGLICYDDDDNYIKWSYEYDYDKQEGQRLILVRETDARPTHDPAESVSGLKRVWLRLTKRGERYEYAASRDGRKFSVYGEKPWGNGAPKKIGILAKNGGLDGVPEIDARFDFFELRAPAPPGERDGKDKD